MLKELRQHVARQTDQHISWLIELWCIPHFPSPGKLFARIQLLNIKLFCSEIITTLVAWSHHRTRRLRVVQRWRGWCWMLACGVPWLIAMEWLWSKYEQVQSDDVVPCGDAVLTFRFPRSSYLLYSMESSSFGGHGACLSGTSWICQKNVAPPRDRQRTRMYVGSNY